jgi:hypothetical protein
MALNAAQRNALAATLQLLEERCDQIDALLRHAQGGQALQQVAADVPVSAAHALAAGLAGLRGEIARLAVAYGLATEPRSAARTIDALLATSWAELEDIRPAKLRAYGQVDPASAARLEADIAQVLARIRALRALLNTEDRKGVLTGQNR